MMHLARLTTGLVALGFALAPVAAAHAPHDVVEEITLSPNYAQDGTILAAIQLTEHAFFAKSVDRGMSWLEIGREAVEKKVQSIVFSPDFANDSTVFCGTKNGGVYRSVDGGLTWTSHSNGMTAVDVRALAISPTFAVDGRMMAATKHGLYRSADGGATWTRVHATFAGGAFEVVAYGGSADVVFAGGEALFRSLDGGDSWASLLDFRRPFSGFAVSPSFATDHTLAASFGLSGANGVFVSTDAGATWATMNTGLGDLAVLQVAIADDGTFLATSATEACYRTSGPHGTWTLSTGGFEALSKQTNAHYPTLAVSPSYSTDGEVFVGGWEGGFRSKDGGRTFRQLDLYHQRINRFLEIAPSFAQDGRVLAGNYGGGPFLYDHGADSWDSLGVGISSLWCGALEYSPTYAVDQTIVYGYFGTWRSTNGGASWTKILEQNAVTRSVAMSPQFATDGVMFLNAATDGTVRSADGGDSFTPVPGLPAIRMNQIVLSTAYPTDPTVYVTPVNGGLLRSTDDAQTWGDASGPFANRNVRALAMSPSFAADGVLLAGTVGYGLFRSNDRGASWSPLTGLPSGAADTIETLAISPTFAVDQTLWAVSFFDGVHQSTDGGFTWQSKNAGLPVDAKRVIRLSPDYANDQTVFVTTHAWTYKSTDDGQTWTKLPGYVRVDDKHPTVFRDESWANKAHADDFGGGVQRADQAGATFAFECFADRVDWLARLDGESGLAEIYLDGNLVLTRDLYSATAVPNHVVWSKTFPTAGWHEVRVTVTGQKNASSNGSFVNSDGFLVRF